MRSCGKASSAVRELTLAEGELYVVTGPAFIGDRLERLHHRVLVPTHLFKAIYSPSTRVAGAYWAPNDGSQDWEPISISRLTQLIGIDVFPDIAARAKETAMPLPQPRPRHRCRLHSS